MTRRFPVKEIARQAGLGTATVDRVLNGRPHVSPQAQARVATALRELEAQERLLSARGRRLHLDIVAEAPARFTHEIRRAAEAALAPMAGAVIRLRFHFHEVMRPTEAADLLDRLARRGTDALCVKLRDTPEVRGAIDRLAGAGLPVFTLVTDLPGTGRRAYLGLDNARAGRTAAHLLARGLPAAGPPVLTLLSQDSFAGETARLAAFRAEMGRLRPACRIVGAAGGAGLARQTAARVGEILHREGAVGAVYSIGGANSAILETLAAHGVRGVPFVAHDLDRENIALLRRGVVDFVLHHDLTDDMRSLQAATLGAHGLIPWQPQRHSSEVRIVGPHNIPEDPRQRETP